MKLRLVSTDLSESLMSRAWPAKLASVKRRLSAPMSRETSSGSMTLPFVFDILAPCSSRTIACRYTTGNGTSPRKCMPIIIIRATQKNRMSKPVSMTLFG